jgi:hypothetical protein
MSLFIQTDIDAFFHCESADGNDLTLCGLDINGGDCGIEPSIPSRANVNCPQCLEIIRFCKKIRLPRQRS